MTTPLFVSILQAGGASRAKQQPVNSIGDSSLSGRCPHTLDPIPGRRGETRKIGVAGTRRFPEPGSNSTFAGVRVLTHLACPFTAPGRDAPDREHLFRCSTCESVAFQPANLSHWRGGILGKGE